MTNDLHHLAGAYALDALDDDERQAFEAHYPYCEICSADVTDHRETAAQLAAAAASDPRPGLRAEVLAAIGETRQLSPLPDRPPGAATTSRRRRWLGPALVAAAVLAVAVTGVAVVRVLDDEGGPTDDLVALLAEPDAVMSPLAGEGPGSLLVVWSPERGEAVLVASALPPAGDDMVYELWHLRPDGPEPVTLFDPDAQGRVTTTVELEADPAAGWGVTIEPAGGSPQPTGSILFATDTT